MKKTLLLSIGLLLSISLFGCSRTNDTQTVQTSQDIALNDSSLPEKDSITINDSYSSEADGEHAIEADGESASYANIKVVKTGDSSGDQADFYGENAAVFATNGAVLELESIVVETDGTHANGVFSYGEGTIVNITDSVIETSGNCSGGLMTTGKGTMNAENLNIHTTGNSSAAIRSDRGGGIVNVTEGSYITDGKGSPVIYSTADITVSDAYLESTSSQGVVVEGQNSVTLNNVELVANNVSKNSDKSEWYQAVMIYQSMSGDADEGLACFNMKNGSLLNRNGDIFFVNNTVATINLENADITNEDDDGCFLRAAAAGWGTEGSNGGQVTMNLYDQIAKGDIIVDEVSSLNLYIRNGSAYSGAINEDNSEGKIYVEIEEGSKWTLASDSYITSLTCTADSIDLNGYKLYVNGVEYSEKTESQGEAVTVETDSSSHGDRPQLSGSEHGHGDSQKPSEKPEDHNN